MGIAYPKRDGGMPILFGTQTSAGHSTSLTCAGFLPAHQADTFARTCRPQQEEEKEEAPAPFVHRGLRQHTIDFEVYKTWGQKKGPAAYRREHAS